MDGNYHLHVAAWFKEKIRTSDVRFMDFDGYHPNIRGCRVKNKAAALKYLQKEDADPLQYNMDILEELRAR